MKTLTFSIVERMEALISCSSVLVMAMGEFQGHVRYENCNNDAIMTDGICHFVINLSFVEIQ